MRMRLRLIAACMAFLMGSCSSSPSTVERRVVVIGHRGNPAEAPENTIASIASAFAVGCDLVEVDVHLSRDGIPVIIHDETLDRTTNGHGLVAEKTLAEMKALDAGTWKDKQFAGERIPTLTEALRAAQGKGRLLLDVKVDGMGAIIAQTFKALDLPVSTAVIATWGPEQRVDMVEHINGAMIVQAEEIPETWEPDYFAKLRALGVRIFDIPNWTRTFIEDAHAYNMPVWVYTINDVQTMRQVISEGVDGFETDIPRKAVEVARELRVKP